MLEITPPDPPVVPEPFTLNVPEVLEREIPLVAPELDMDAKVKPRVNVPVPLI